MSEGATTPSPGPLASAIHDAKDGKLTVNYDSKDVVVNAEEFAYIDRDCAAFKQEIRGLQRIAARISDREKWGLGESTDGLKSAAALVAHFRGKASIIDASKDSDNNIHDILQKHYDIIDDIQTLHKTIAQQYVQQDQEFAARYNQLMANMPPSLIGNTTVQPGVIAQVGVGQDR